MSKIKATKNISATKELLWKTISDIGGIHLFHPLVESSPLLSENNRGIGAMRTCHFYDGTSVSEEVTEWVEGQKITFKLSDMSMPLKWGNASMELRTLAQNKTSVTIEMEYEVKYGLLGKLMDTFMLQRMMPKMMNQVLDSLDHYVQTGETIGKKGPTKLPQSV